MPQCDESQINVMLDLLEYSIIEAKRNNKMWKEVWNEIKNIGQSFKGSKFPTVKDREKTWSRFQSIIERVKESQKQVWDESDEKVKKSKSHLNRIYSLANSATPSSGFDDTILFIATGGLSMIINDIVDTIFGPLDNRKDELIQCNIAMREGWDYLRDKKGSMLSIDKKEAFDALTRASENLNAKWDEWKKERAIVNERYHNERQVAWEERQAKRREIFARREAWEERMRENISKCQNTLVTLESVLGDKKRNLSKLKNMKDEAKSDKYLNQIEEWIDEEIDRINDIESKIGEIKSWVVNTEEKLR